MNRLLSLRIFPGSTQYPGAGLPAAPAEGPGGSGAAAVFPLAAGGAAAAKQAARTAAGSRPGLLR